MLPIRRAESQDAFLIVGITRAAFASTAGDLPSSVLAERVAEVRAHLSLGGALIASMGTRPVGVVRFQVEAGALCFSRLAVLPCMQGRGIGAALLDALEREALRRALVELRASARSTRPDRRPFYLKRGFNVVGSEDVYGVSALKTHLRKVLATSKPPERS